MAPNDSPSARRPPISKLGDARAPALGAQAAVPPGEARRARGPRERHQRAAAGAPSAHEVADVDLHGLRPGVLEREGGGDVAGHAVVAERGEQHHAGALGARAEVLEHPALEAGLAGGVEVVRAALDGRVNRGVAPSANGPTVLTRTSPGPDERRHGCRRR